MAIRAYLEGAGGLDPETIHQMGVAFEMALASLGSTPNYADPVRETVARKIIEFAQAGEGALKQLALGVGTRAAK